MVLWSLPPPVPGGHQPFSCPGACVLSDGSCTIFPSAPGPGGTPPRIILFHTAWRKQATFDTATPHSTLGAATVSGHLDSSGRVRHQSAESPMFHASSLRRGLMEAPLPRLWLRRQSSAPTGAGPLSVAALSPGPYPTPSSISASPASLSLQRWIDWSLETWLLPMIL